MPDPNNLPLLSLPELGGIHISHPPIAKSLQRIVDYINANVTPAPGNRVTSNKNPGGNA